MLRLARDLDMLTIGYAFNAADTRRLMREAAPDIYIFHAGITGGGSTGDAAASSLEDTARRSERHFAIARKIKPDVILLAHGAAIVDPERRACHARANALRRRPARLEHRADGDRAADRSAHRRLQGRQSRMRAEIERDAAGAVSRG